MQHFLIKLGSTILTLALARTFGRYEVTGDQLTYAIYHWLGRRWAGPLEVSS